MPAVKKTAYALYMELVKKNQDIGIPNQDIISELESEIHSIEQRKATKCAELSLNRSPYPMREAVRAAHECITAIERICRELAPQEARELLTHSEHVL